jgi:FlaA1/EpsC-like NDP-sugar epimerase
MVTNFTESKKSLLAWMVAKRRWLLVLVYVGLFALSYKIAFWLRFDLSIPPEHQAVFVKSLPWLIVIKLLIFHRFGSFHGWWRFVTFADLVTLLSVATLSLLVIAGIDHFVIAEYQIPRAVLLLDWGVTILLIGGLRSIWRLTRDYLRPLVGVDGRRPALVVGSPESCEALARQIHHDPKLNFRIVGFLDDDPSLHGSRLGGIPFLGSSAHAAVLAIEHRVQDVLVIANSLSGKRLRRLMAQCRQAEINLSMVPPLDELLSGSFRLQVRDVDINDLLGRDPVELDAEEINKLIAGRCVLVTGAGGSIGSEICRQILRRRPRNLILVERAENCLFEIEQELLQTQSGALITPSIADICDKRRMQSLFEEWKPEIVFHAAAHKHVPLMEFNPGEAIKNNVYGTIGLANMAEAHGVERFVMISTDKAVNPTSVMGASKQLAERYIHAFSERSRTKFVTVRFGNVLGSKGSVVPIFQDQIRRGGPLTITHPEMRRYFMTIPEASQLVLQAATMGKGGEIFVLDMGQPVKILDLARDLVRLSGYAADEIEIQFTGVRPGEKLFEELHFGDEETLATGHPKVRVAYHRLEGLDDVEASITSLASLVHEPPREIRERLLQLCDAYCPAEDRGAAFAEAPAPAEALRGNLAIEPS